MKKSLVVLTMVIAIVAFLVGCGQSPLITANQEVAKNLTDIAAAQMDAAGKGSTPDTASKEAIENFVDLAEAQEEIAKNYDENDPEAAVKMMETYAEFGAKMELQEFEKMESLDPPSDFPSDLIYDKGKITSSSDDGDNNSYINKSITIQTTEDVKAIRSFYKNLFSQPTWKLTSQSSESGGASYEATDSANIGVNVYVSSDSYSKIVNISITYSGDITE